VVVRDVAVGEHALVDVELVDQTGQFRTGVDRDPVWIERTGEFRRIDASSMPGICTAANATTSTVASSLYRVLKL
jgi:hypothetical protein